GPLTGTLARFDVDASLLALASSCRCCGGTGGFAARGLSLHSPRAGRAVCRRLAPWMERAAMNGLVDIHCHLLPGIDDGAADLGASLAMARMSVEQGVDTVIVTPHQLGAFAANRGDDIRRRTAALQSELDRAGVALRVLPGADVRIEDHMIAGLESG